MEELQRQITELQTRVKNLEETTNYSATEGMKDRFFEKLETTTTTTTSVPEGGGDVAIPNVTGGLILVYKGKRYKLLYE